MTSPKLLHHTIHWAKIESQKYAVLSPGYSEGTKSVFIDEITRFLTNININVVTLDYRFHLSPKNEPSQDLSYEVDELERCIENILKVNHPKSLTLIGKSLGGVISLAYLKKFNKKNFPCVILGLPLLLGFPPKLTLLKEKSLLLPLFQKEYSSLLENLSSKIYIIQGTKDDLGNLDAMNVLESIFNNITVSFIEEANHSFTGKVNKLQQALQAFFE